MKSIANWPNVPLPGLNRERSGKRQGIFCATGFEIEAGAEAKRENSIGGAGEINRLGEPGLDRISSWDNYRANSIKRFLDYYELKR